MPAAIRLPSASVENRRPKHLSSTQDLSGDEADLSEASVTQRIAPAFAAGSFFLAGIEAAQLVGVIGQGLTTPHVAPAGIPGDVWERVGLAFFQNVGLVNGLVLVAALGLTAGSLILDAQRDRGRQLRKTSTWLCGALGVLFFFGSLLALRARVHTFSLTHHPMPSAQRWALFIYLVGTLGPAIVVVVGAWVCLHTEATIQRQSRDR
jgi:hypothetical protein